MLLSATGSAYIERDIEDEFPLAEVAEQAFRDLSDWEMKLLHT